MSMPEVTPVSRPKISYLQQTTILLIHSKPVEIITNPGFLIMGFETPYSYLSDMFPDLVFLFMIDKYSRFAYAIPIV